MTNNQKVHPLGFIERILNIIPVERIYLNQFEYKHAQFKELVILMPKSSRINSVEALPLVNMVMSEFPEYHCRVFKVQEVRYAIQQGSLSFFRICMDENLLHAEEGLDGLYPERMIKPKSVIGKARKNFEKEQAKIDGFKKGADFYFKQGLYSLSAFMLHQVIELSYRAAEILLLGKDKISHSIKSHQRMMQRYASELSMVFSEENEEEYTLLMLLDEAYQAVRYENDYEISLEQLHILQLKAEKVGVLLHELYKTLIAEFEYQFGMIPKDEVAVASVAIDGCHQVWPRVELDMSWIRDYRYYNCHLV